MTRPDGGPDAVRRRRYGNRHQQQVGTGERLTSRSRRGVVGRHWWAQRFSQILGESTPPERLHRGRALARGGSVFRFRIETGEARAEVRHSRTELHEVVIRHAPLPPEEWDILVEVLASRAAHLGALLSGRLEPELEEELRARGIALFPNELEALEMECSCPDPIVPCSHIAAVFYLVAERLDKDPFLLFRFRGRRRDLILSEGRRLRSIHALAAPSEDEPGAVTLPGPGNDEEGGTLHPGTFWGDAAEIARMAGPSTLAEVPRPILDELGPPPTVERGSIAERVLREAYEIGSGPSGASPPPEDEPELEE